MRRCRPTGPSNCSGCPMSRACRARTGSSGSTHHNGPQTTLALMEAAAKRQRGRAVAVGPEHDARRCVRALHGTRAARRAAASVRAGQSVHDATRVIWDEPGPSSNASCGGSAAVPILIVMSMVMPIVQLVVLGYAFGGNVKHLKLAIVDQDHGVPAVRIREMASARRLRRADDRHIRLRRPGPGARRPAQRPGQRRADDSAGFLPPDAGERTIRRSRSSRTTPTTSSRWRWPARSAACWRHIRSRSGRCACRRCRRWMWSRSIPTSRTSSTCCRDPSSCRSSSW